MRSKQITNPIAFVLAALAATALLLAAATSAFAAAPVWRIDSLSDTTAAPGDSDPSTPEHTYLLEIANVGDEIADPSLEPIELGVELPEEVEAVEAHIPFAGFEFPWECPGGIPGSQSFSFPPGTHSVTCAYIGGPITAGGGSGKAMIALDVSLDASSGDTPTSSFAVSGGKAGAASTVDPLRISATPPPFGLDAFDVQAVADPSGQPFTQAAAHPYAIATYFDLNTETNPEPIKGEAWPVEPTRDVIVSAPAGLLGNPSAFGECTAVQLANSAFVSAQPECPTTSQLGTISVRSSVPGTFNVWGPLPLFNMVPASGEPARFGFQVAGTSVVIGTRLRSESDYGIDFLSRRIGEGLAVAGAHVTFWGVPTDPRHNAGLERACPGQPAPWEGGPTCPADFEQPAFIRMPTSCTAANQGLPWKISTDSWFNPGAELPTGAPDLSDPAWDSISISSHKAPGYPRIPEDWGDQQGLTGCGGVPVKGELTARPTALDTETPTGLEVHVEVPNPGLDAHEGIATSDVKKVKVTLPQGVTINPSQAEGLGVCSPAQYESTELSFHPTPGSGCPDDSKIGTVLVKTPLLEETIPGDVYVAQQDDPSTTTPGAENPFDSLLAIYIVLREPERGVLIKLPGEVDLEHPEHPGQIVTTFDDLPQQPFSSFDFKFREGARAPLVTPPTCGTYTTEAEFTPWSNPNQILTSTSSFQITRGIGGGPCPPGGIPGFKPGFSAGTLNNNAGSFSPFNMRLTRLDGEQNLTKFSSVLPPGVSAKIAGVGKCPEAAIAAAKGKTGRQELAAPSCPANSQIGRTLAGAGVGSVLTYVAGRIYLAGPWEGAPLSVVAITPAVAGPFDVGTVVVREALTLDPVTAEVHVDGDKSDPIPHILKGIPLKLRDLRVYVDRQSFTINPTSCDPSQVGATLWGSAADVFNPADDVPVALAARFQAAGCAALGFKPRLSLRLKGGTKRGAHPALRAVFRPRPGDANLERTVVKLPRSAFLDQAHIRTICTRVQFAADTCPKGAIYGQVTAFSPLLDEPLKGPAYLRSSDNKLPDLVFDLHGIVDIEASARIDSVRGGIRATFPKVPDAPLSKVIVEMQGGRKGLIQNSRNLCAAPSRAEVKLDGHNGKARDFTPIVKPQCGKKRRAGRG